MTTKNKNTFIDILEPRRREVSTLFYFFHEHYAQVAYKQTCKPKPEALKLFTLKYLRAHGIVEKFSEVLKLPKEVVEEKIKGILDEIGFGMSLGVIRSLGVVLAKICLRICTSLLVHEESILRMKNVMGNTPVVLVPSHRSYADFILMSYILFTYNIAIPVTAAGMDFHSMKGMGEILRQTGALFIRRSYNDDGLYWTTFRSYIHQLVTKHDAPIQFFVEGTRSRSGKSLMPKYGLLSMVIKAFVSSEVPDILFVPVNISYDRVLEERLFAFELLGVPKPKESTSGLIKSLNIINDNYGSVYFNFGEPFSLKTYLENKINRSDYVLQPYHTSQLDEPLKKILPDFALHIVDKQRNLSTITTFNLIAISLTTSLAENRKITLDELEAEVIWLTIFLEEQGVEVYKQEVREALRVHKNIVRVEESAKIVELIFDEIKLERLHTKQLKAHVFTDETMTCSVPLVMLQLYVNPVLHVLIDSMLIVHVLVCCREMCDRELLFEKYAFLRNLFSYDFLLCEKDINKLFGSAMHRLCHFGVVKTNENAVILANDHKVTQIFSTLIAPFVISYKTVMTILLQNQFKRMQEALILKTAQETLEKKISERFKDFIHPYVLSLDTLKNCLNSLILQQTIKKENLNGSCEYSINYEVLSKVNSKLELTEKIKTESRELKSKL